MVNVAYELWRMKRQKSHTMQGRKFSYLNRSNASTSSTVGVKSILKNSLKKKDSLLESLEANVTPLNRRESTTDDASVSTLNKCIVKFNSKPNKSKSRKKEKNSNLLTFMDKNKLYFNSLREHMKTMREKPKYSTYYHPLVPKKLVRLEAES
jgi:hypothetical protein